MSNGLDRLWAGWRSAYVAGIHEEPTRSTAPADQPAEPADQDKGSVFTRILNSGLSDEETHIVWRGVEVFAILNAFPYGTGHLLVMPFREVPKLDDLTESESIELWQGIRKAVAAVETAYKPGGVNVGFNLGEAAGAGVPTHLHAHVLPRWSADTNFMTAVANTKVLPEALDVTASKLRSAWPA